MTISNIINTIADKYNIPKTTCEKVIDAFVEEIKCGLVNGEKVVLKNFIGLEPYDRPERIGRNPKTGKVEKFPSVRAVKVRVSQAFKDAVAESEK